DWAEARQLDRSKICCISITQTHSNAAEAVSTGSVDYFIDANELYRIFNRTGVNLKKISVSDFDCFGDVPAVNDKLQSLLAPGSWEMKGFAQELSVPVNGEMVKAMRCNNLGQARSLLDAVTKGDLGVSVINLFS
ncbi:MAG: [Fe-Fe] hydrogenase large subunit C-terminal domain-containing protein, partial [Sporomusa sp.]